MFSLTSYCRRIAGILPGLAAAGLLALLEATASGVGAPAAEPPPNVIVILADDLGYGDLGCYGSKTIATPRLDRMAREGVRFTDFYVAAPFCSPSRAALLTGRLPVRAGVPYVLFPTEHTGLPVEELTLAEVLQPAGYATACIGKWHLGWRRELRPQRQGFGEFYGLIHTNDVEEWTPGTAFRQLSLFAPLDLRDGDTIVEAPVDQAQLTQRYTRRALDFIRRNRDRPFFLYLAHTMPHIPQYASPAFAGKSKDGVYGDAIEELDWSTGQILDLLQELGLGERTLVIFTSDNGAGQRAARANPQARFPGRSFGGSNGQLRAGKGSTYEGGIRVPGIAWWPGTIAAGRNEAAPVSTLDLFPTVARLGRAEIPAGLKLDGQDVGPVLRGEASNVTQRTMYHYFGGQLQAVRQGAWKLIVPVTQLPATRVPSLWFEHQPAIYERQHRLMPKAALYNLADDIGEKRDLAESQPEVVARLLAQAQTFDRQLQTEIPAVRYLPGPRPPAPGQIRQASDNVGTWLELAR